MMERSQEFKQRADALVAAHGDAFILGVYASKDNNDFAVAMTDYLEEERPDIHDRILKLAATSDPYVLDEAYELGQIE